MRGIVKEDEGKMRVKPSIYYGLQRTEMKRKAGTDSLVEDISLDVAKFL